MSLFEKLRQAQKKKKPSRRAQATPAVPQNASGVSTKGDASDDGVGEESHELLRGEIETDALLDATRRVQEHQERAAQAASGAAAVPNKKKARRATETPARDVTLVPPVPSRSTRTAGGALKPQGMVFRALYDRSDLLCKTMATLAKFYKLLPLTFTPRGLEIAALDSTHMMFARMTVSKEAFVRYENLTQEAIEIFISTKALERVSRMSTKSSSMSFMYDQYGRDDEVMHLMYYPRTAEHANEQCMRTSFRNSNKDRKSVV